MPISKMQREYLDNANRRWCFKTGATRSGKTYIDTLCVIPKRIRARIGKPGLAVILGVTKSTIERNILEPMRNIWGTDLVGEINSQNICFIAQNIISDYQKLYQQTKYNPDVTP